MIALSIAAGTATPLTIADSGTGTYVLVAFEPGTRQRDNAFATSRWADGGALVSSTLGLQSMDLVVRINAATPAAVVAAGSVLDAALGQYSYTITATMAAGAATYTCLPASSTALAYDPVQFRNGTGVLSASIPRQP